MRMTSPASTCWFPTAIPCVLVLTLPEIGAAVKSTSSFRSSPPVRGSSSAIHSCGPPASTSSKLSKTTRSEEHTSELQSLMRISYAVFCLKKIKKANDYHNTTSTLKYTNHY